MALPVIAIVGRPNVGKSSLLNRLAGRQIAIVEPTAGVTRDRVATVAELGDRWAELVDTGGMEFDDQAELAEDIARQIDTAIRQATAIIFVVDIRDGLTPLDREVADRLRRADVPVVLAANKTDTRKDELAVGEFYGLGWQRVLPVSAKQGRGIDELVAAVAGHLPADAAEPPEKPVMEIAVVGKRNAGKSTFINALAGSERVIVSERPGTTRDAIDIRFRKDDREYLAIDTAGIRRRKSLADDIEFYSLHRAMRSIRRADVVLFLIDATTPVSRVDKKLGAEIEKQEKPVVLVVNKWDLAEGYATSEEYADYLNKTMPGLSFAPLSFTTAATGENVEATVDLVGELYDQARTRVSTSVLNEVVEDAVRRRRPPSPRARLPKIYYATQVGTEPPTIVLFVNDPDLFKQDYRRFIENRFREELPFPEVPMRIHFRRHRDRR